MWMLASVIALVLVSGLAATAQEASRPAPLVGVWLIEPDRYDPLVENGIDIPRYPVLLLREDGSFAAYHLHFTCDARDREGRLADEPGGPTPAEAEQLCAREALESGADIGVSTARRIVAGTVRRSEPFRLTFATTDRLAPESGVADLAGRLRTMPDGATLGRLLDALWRPAFLEPGASVDGELTGDVLRLRVGGADVVSYRRYDRAVLSGAAQLVLALGVSGGQYFRCVLTAVDGAFAVDAEKRSEAQKALVVLVGTAAELAAGDRAMAAASLAPGDPVRARDVEAHARRRASLVEQMSGSPVYAALQAGALGRALGCPDRDRWPP
jgi:hypothetical protein